MAASSVRTAMLAAVTAAATVACGDGTGPSITAPFAAVSTGVLHSCGLTTAGDIYCWGWNRDGQLGDGTTSDRTTPAAVRAGGVTFAQVAAGGGHTCGVATDGLAYCWGFNLTGQLGDGSRTARVTPVAVAGGLTFSMLSAGSSYTCGVTAAQAAHCWGWNAEGQLGDGTTADQSAPVPVAGGLAFASVSAGSFHTCGITTAGDTYCWGRGGSGQLGDGAAADAATPVPVSGGHRFVEVSAGFEHTCGLTTAQAVWCWGKNTYGQLGLGPMPPTATTPAMVVGSLSFADLSAGALFSCGVTTSDAAYCWGFAGNGQLGTDDVDVCTDPDGGFELACALDPRAVQGSLAFAAVRAGTQHTCGITRANVVYCWGLGTNGQLGNGRSGETELSVVPVRVLGQN